MLNLTGMFVKLKPGMKFSHAKGFIVAFKKLNFYK